MTTTKKKKRAKSKKKTTSTKKKTTKRKAPVKKKTTRRKTSVRRTRTAPVTINMPPMQQSQEPEINKLMLENFVALQRVLTNTSTKIENLTTQITKLLDLFEISAKSLADREFEIEKDNKETLEKLNSLLDQNKILARGLSLMHERMPQDQFPHPVNIPPQQTFQTMPPMAPPMTQQKSSMTRELSPISPPFQAPPLNFQQPNTPKTREMSEPSSFGSINSDFENEEDSSDNNYERNTEEDLSDVPDPEDFELESPPK